MADNVPLTTNAALRAATDEVTYSGDTANVQLVRVVDVTGAEGSKTVTSISPSVDYTHDTALTAGSTAGPALMLRATNAAVAAVSATDDAVLALASMLGKLVMLPYAVPALTWNYAAAAGGLVNTTGVSVKAAAGAGIRNYVTSIQAINSHATISTEVVIRDGAAGTVLHRGWAQAAGGGYAAKFDPPLRGTANTLVEIAEVSTTATAGVLVNLQGFTAGE
jgi:hypothetical protein